MKPELWIWARISSKGPQIGTTESVEMEALAETPEQEARSLHAARVFMYLCLAQTIPLLALAGSGRMRASVLSTGSSSPSCPVPEAVLKLGKKRASSLQAWSLSSLPCTALSSVSVPYCARKLQEPRGEK